MAEDTLTPRRRLSFDEVRAKIQRNKPKERSPLRWRKVNEHCIVSTCERFVIDRHGDGDAARFTAKLRPMTIIGHRCFTADQAKSICEAHASPLPLEPPKPCGTAPSAEAPQDQPRPDTSSADDREPGSDDDA